MPDDLKTFRAHGPAIFGPYDAPPTPLCRAVKRAAVWGSIVGALALAFARYYYGVPL